MSKLKQLEDMFSQGKITRRDFLARASALAATIAISPSLFPTSAHASTPKKGGRFRVGLNTAAITDSLDTTTLVTSWICFLNYQLRNNLVEVDHKGDIIPELAESWESYPGAKKWVFKLRKGVEFHNGKTFDADDVVYNMNLHRGEASKSASKILVTSVTDIKTDGKNAVIFTLDAGNADFPAVMANLRFTMVPAGTKGTEFEKGIGTGAYILESFEPGVRSLVKRNPNYFKEGRAHFDEVETFSMQDVSTRTSALRTGRIDFMSQCDLKTIRFLKKTPGIQILQTPSGGHYTLPMLTDTPPFDNNDIRLALKYAIDREHIVKAAMGGYATVGNDHPIASDHKYFASELPQRQYDPDKAKFHLKKAGLKELSVTLNSTSLRDFVDIAQLCKEHAAKANINIEVKNLPADSYWAKAWGKLPFTHSLWNPSETADIMFTKPYARGAANNESHFDNERFNNLLLWARSELDEAKRKEMYVEMQTILHDEGGSVIYLFRDFVEAASDKVKFKNIANNWPYDGNRCAERWWFA